jgi:uncharacterized protein (DUF433 family)
MTPIYNDKIIKIYGADPREIPLYGFADTARYLKLPVITLRSWVYGRNYRKGGEKRKSLPVIKLPDKNTPLLSFMNLVEVHVLSAITRVHKVQFNKVRNTLRTLERLNNNASDLHPLANNDFWVDKFDIFVEEQGDYICTSRDGQIVIKEVIEQYLLRVDRDVDLSAFRIYPFSKELLFSSLKDTPKTVLENSPKNISIDPLIAFGRPTISGTGIATNVIAGRFGAGEKIENLAKDYEIDEDKIQEAIDYEGTSRKAA